MLLRYAVWINKTKSASTGGSTAADTICNVVAAATIASETIGISKEFIGMCARLSSCLLIHFISITVGANQFGQQTINKC